MWAEETLRVKHDSRCRALPNRAKAPLQGREDRLWEELLGTENDSERAAEGAT